MKKKNQEIKRFWAWIDSEDRDGERILHLDGEIAEDSWWGDEITPGVFRSELNKGKGPVTIWINSYGGDVFAAAQIYNMIREYPGKVTVKKGLKKGTYKVNVKLSAAGNTNYKAAKAKTINLIVKVK